MSEPARHTRFAILAAWALTLALLGFFVQRHLQIGTDLRLFLPTPSTAEERLLLTEIGEGPGSRLLLLALAGAPAAELADASRDLAAELTAHPLFRLVTNGELAPDDAPEELLAYRYLLSPNLDTHTFDAATLRAELQARARDLASPAGAFLESWLPRDPTLELLTVLQRWQPAREPNRLYDVWFDRDGKRALLLAETRAASFDPDAQRAAIAALRAAHVAIDPDQRLSLTISGTGQFSVMMQERTRREAETFGVMATLGMIILMLSAYRSGGALLYSALPLASAGLTGLSAVSAWFGTVHGITLAFGFTLIGVAQDYPVHLLSHRQPARANLAVVRELWPTLATGVASTCIAYLAFVFAGVVGLQQLACFTIAGLAAASLTTRFLLPRVLPASTEDYGASPRLQRLWERIDRLPHIPWLAPVLIAAAVGAVALVRTPMWENDLSKLTPVPVELLQQDQALRSELGAADVRYLLIVEAADTEQALQRLESLEPALDGLVASGAIGGFDHAARYLPSARTQRARQARLPDAEQLRASLSTAQAGSGFREGVFAPFLADVERARGLPPLTPEALAHTSFGANLDMLVARHESGARALVSLNDVADPDALATLVRSQPDILLLDLKGASETLVARQRTHILWSLAAAAILLGVVVAFALRRARRVYRVIAPMLATTCVVVAILLLAGQSLSLFHLIALMLAAGLGLDYALFFEHAGDDVREQRRTLHAVIVCALSTLLVFALLSFSTIPVLRAIGTTVALGVISNFLLALLLAREPSRTPHR